MSRLVACAPWQPAALIALGESFSPEAVPIVRVYPIRFGFVFEGGPQ